MVNVCLFSCSCRKKDYDVAVRITILPDLARETW